MCIRDRFHGAVETLETIARAGTPQGEVALRRRGDAIELIVNGVFAMDSRELSLIHI